MQWQIKITYPGTNNFTSFVYDGLSRNVRIEETENGSLTGTRQFVWCGASKCESRDTSGANLSQYFGRGQKSAGTGYFYSKDHLGSVREMTDNSGAIQAQNTFDLFGRTTKLSGTIEADFQFAGYYLHSRSGLYITRTRAYNSYLARFLCRDPLDRSTDVNLYRYTNSPARYVDPSGLDAKEWTPGDFEKMNPRYPGIGAGVASSGCFGGVSAVLGLGDSLPEPQLFKGGPTDATSIPSRPTKCWWGSGLTPDAAVNKANCHRCGANEENYVWCKQGILNTGVVSGKPGQEITVNPNTLFIGAEASYNYSLWDPTNGYVTGNTPESSPGCPLVYTDLQIPWGSGAHNASYCCGTCVPKKK